jgi:hypothetical protein
MKSGWKNQRRFVDFSHTPLVLWIIYMLQVPTRQHVLPTSSQSLQVVSRQPIIVPSTSQLSYTSTKRSHTRCNLSTSTTSSSPPHKKLAPVQAVSPEAALFHSPDRSDLMQALRSGGTANLDVAQGEFGIIRQHAPLTGFFL